MIVAALLLAAAGAPQLTNDELRGAFMAESGEAPRAVAPNGDPMVVHDVPAGFRVGKCRALGERRADCSFAVRWSQGGWHAKHGQFERRADGTWIADEASRKALYE